MTLTDYGICGSIKENRKGEITMAFNKSKLRDLKIEAGLCSFEACTPEEYEKYLQMINDDQELPTDIIAFEDNVSMVINFKRYIPRTLDEEKEIWEYLELKKHKNIKNHKKLRLVFHCFCYNRTAHYWSNYAYGNYESVNLPPPAQTSGFFLFASLNYTVTMIMLYYNCSFFFFLQ